MYDFWYTLGTAIMQPKLLDAINAAKPVFKLHKRLVIEKADQPGAWLRKMVSTGWLDETSTTNIRGAIAAFLRVNCKTPPPVGIYTAGRFCQLSQIVQFNSKDTTSTFRKIIDNANTAYLGAAKIGISTQPAFPALLGLCMMDGNFVGKFQGRKAVEVDSTTKEMFGEFGITVSDANLEFQIVNAFVSAQDFQDAYDDFMGTDGDLDPWTDDGTTFEQIYFWAGKSDYAIT